MWFRNPKQAKVHFTLNGMGEQGLPITVNFSGSLSPLNKLNILKEFCLPTIFNGMAPSGSSIKLHVFFFSMKISHDDKYHCLLLDENRLFSYHGYMKYLYHVYCQYIFYNKHKMLGWGWVVFLRPFY